MTFAAAKAAVVAATITALGDTTVAVLPFDPPTVTPDMVTVSTAGLAATEYRLFVRIYVRAIDSQQGQDRADALTEALEAGRFPFPRSEWEFVYDEVKDSFYMQTVVEYPREDF